MSTELWVREIACEGCGEAIKVEDSNIFRDRYGELWALCNIYYRDFEENEYGLQPSEPEESVEELYGE